MYYYVYDEFVQDAKHEKELALIETRLTDLGISGKIARLALFRDASELIRDEVRKGVKTVVAVGNDGTLRKVIGAVARAGVAMAVIPVGTSNNTIASMLGIKPGAEACEIVAARIVQNLDMGSINDRRFIHQVHFPKTKGLRVECEHQFTLQVPPGGGFEVRNLAYEEPGLRAANPLDGKLDLAKCAEKKSGWFSKQQAPATCIPVTSAIIYSERPTTALVDGEAVEGTEFHIKVVPKSLKLIAGKGRIF